MRDTVDAPHHLLFPGELTWLTASNNQSARSMQPTPQGAVRRSGLLQPISMEHGVERSRNAGVINNLLPSMSHHHRIHGLHHNFQSR